MNDESKIAIESVSVDMGCLYVSGWCWAKRPIESLEVYLRLNGLRIEIQHCNLPSPDLIPHHGYEAANCRFRAEITIDNWDLTAVRSAEILIHFRDGGYRSEPLVEPVSAGYPTTWRGGRAPRVGIGVTTYNRAKLLTQVVREIKRRTRTPYDLIVCDDGSSDSTVEALREAEVPFISAQNMGIAWNKNRALYYLRVIRRCDVVILLEDDTIPDRDGWEVDWILAILLFGHVNFAGSWFLDQLAGGWGHWFRPYLSRRFSGQCVGFSADALDIAGYMDTRFKKYGFEHIEHTVRMVRNGFGGVLSLPDNRQLHYFLIHGGVEVLPSNSHGTPTLIASNGALNEARDSDWSIREPWRDEAEKRQMQSEIAKCRT